MSKLELLPTAEVAVRLGVDVRTVARWANAGRLTPAVEGRGQTGARFFHAEDVERLAAELAQERSA
jgi:DNA-binding transcriptional MerR regulator